MEDKLRQLLARCSGHLQFCIAETQSECSKELLEDIYKIMPHLNPLYYKKTS